MDRPTDQLTARPARVCGLATAIGLVSVVAGLVISVMFNLPPSFFIVSIATLIWAITTAVTR